MESAGKQQAIQKALQAAPESENQGEFVESENMVILPCFSDGEFVQNFAQIESGQKTIGVAHTTVSRNREKLVEKGELMQCISSIGADGKDRPRQVERKAPEKSDRQLAKAIGVSHHTVKAQRDELVGAGEIPQLDRTVGADGKERPLPAG